VLSSLLATFGKQLLKWQCDTNADDWLPW